MHLDMKTALPVIRKAFDNKELQMFRVHTVLDRGCIYSGPCAVGVCFPEEFRKELDSEGPVSVIRLLTRENITVNSIEELDDFAFIQRHHDFAVIDSTNEYSHKNAILTFDKILKQMEEKYS